MKKINITNSLTLKEFIMQSRYEIPWYQRNYAWESKQLNDLVDDIESSRNDEREHFFGIIMTMPHKSDDNKKRIIDGQQRITTTLIYLKSLDHFFEDNNIIDRNNQHCEKILRNIQDCIKGDLSTIIDDSLSNRLSPTRDNEKIFNSIFESNSKETVDKVYNNKSKWPKTNVDLYKSYCFLYNKTSELYKECENIEKFYQEIFHRTIHLLSGFIILPIEVKDQIFAYQFFQTVNDRGNALSITDILKAYFFELSDDDKNKRKKVYDSWNQFTNNLGNVKADTFLRHYWLSRIGVINIKDLLSELKENYNSYNKAIAFLNSIKSEAENYRILNNFEVSDDKEKSALTDIFELAKAFVMPPILAGIKHLSTDKFVKLVKLLTIFVFRYRTICHLENKNMERLFSNIAILIREQKGRVNLNDIKTMLKKINPTDESFNALFGEAKIIKNSVSKYILETIEKYYRGDNFREWDPKMSVEHILPKNSSKWDEFCKKEKFLPETYVNRLGNLTLVTKPLNSKMKNSIFDVKKEAIRDYSNYKINEYVIEREKWNNESINGRQREWGRVASKIWIL